MRNPTTTLERYARGLESGLLSVSEVASAVLEVLADTADWARVWTGAPAPLRGSVLAYLKEVEAANMPPLFTVGPGDTDPAWLAAHTALRRLIVVELLADAEQDFTGD